MLRTIVTRSIVKSGSFGSQMTYTKAMTQLAAINKKCKNAMISYNRKCNVAGNALDRSQKSQDIAAKAEGALKVKRAKLEYVTFMANKRVQRAREIVEKAEVRCERTSSLVDQKEREVDTKVQNVIEARHYWDHMVRLLDATKEQTKPFSDVVDSIRKITALQNRYK